MSTRLNWTDLYQHQPPSPKRYYMTVSNGGDIDGDVDNMEKSGHTIVVEKRKQSGNSDHILKYVSLFVLVIQNASQVLLIRYARTRDKKDMFLSTAAVFWTEVIKLLACVAIICAQETSVRKCFSMIYDQIIKQPIDTLKVCVPAIIYTIQNNLLYVAVSNLDAATFMVTYQLKILTTALFSVWMLKKPLSWFQWLSLVILFVGVSIVQLQEQSKPGASVTTTGLPPTLAIPTSASTKSSASSTTVQSPMLGLSAVVIACLLSGFAGIYFEKILKGSQVSVWMRNIQLAVLAVPISYITMQAKDGAIVNKHGLLYGFDLIVWITVYVYALGGLTVAVVIKYADNILKGFATSVAIVVSCIASVYLFNFMPSLKFIFGTTLVILAIYVYSKFPYQAVNAVVASSADKEKFVQKA